MCSVILPSLTDQMVLSVFKYLVESELRKALASQQEFRFGCQEGMVATLVLMFGESDSVTAEIAYNNGNTWLQIVGDINENLQTWSDTLDQAEDYTLIDFKKMQDAVDKAVNDYALKYPKKLGDALRMYL